MSLTSSTTAPNNGGIKIARLIIGFLIGPLPSAFLAVLAAAMASRALSLLWASRLLLIILAVEYAGMIVFGIPMHLALRRSDRVSWYAYLIGGSVIAWPMIVVTYWVIIFGAATAPILWTDLLRLIPAFPVILVVLTIPALVLGGLASVTFWAVVRPDR